MYSKPAAPQPQRQFYLDWLRIIAFAILIPYHVGMYYVSWDWHIKSPFVLPEVEPWMRLFSPWRMDLLFLVSGAATAHLLRSRGAGTEVLRQRGSRLLWPLVFGVLVIVPPQSYLEVVRRFAYPGSYLEFMQLYLRAYAGFCGPDGRCLILPTWNHLWYLPYLFFYTTLLWLLSAVLRDRFDRLTKTINQRVGVVSILALPIGFLILTLLLLRPQYPITHALLDDWFAHSQYFAMFMFGAVLARTQRLAELAENLRWTTLLIAWMAWVLLVTGSAESVIGRAGSSRLAAILVSMQQWCAVLAALGFGRRLLDIDSPARVYLTEAVFPLYIVHQTLIIVFAKSLSTWAITPVLEFALLIALSCAASLACFELVRRVSGLRTIFGLKSARRTGSMITS